MFSATKGGSPSGYQISRSVRLRSSASAYFNRTMAAGSPVTVYTFSAWVKRGELAFFDGYLTECYLIDGQALTPSSFGETNPVTGVWQPKKYAGTYGTNGFYLNFATTLLRLLRLSVLTTQATATTGHRTTSA
jgi:hypothetical protein